MEASFWVQRWQEGRIGFHEGRPNHFLARYAHELGARRRVLVPLCGKSEDLAFLAAAGHQVVGVELVEAAVRAFFTEHRLEAREQPQQQLRRFDAPSVTLFAGDFFATSVAMLGPCDAFYDRAALVALPDALRALYVQHLRSLLQRGARGLVVTFEYPQAAMEGPPFAVSEAELRAHYDGAQLELLGEAEASAPRLAELGVRALERCFLVTL